MNTDEFQGKWGIILGGSSGLGLASAKKLASHGMNLIIIHRDRKSDIPAIDKELNLIRQSVRVENFNIDATNLSKMSVMARQILEICGEANVYLLLHSIAKGNLKPISVDGPSLTGLDFNLTISAMGVSFYDWVMEVLKSKLFSKPARVIAFTSEGSSKVHANYAAISAAKSALESISRSLALELAPHRITSNCVMAGTTDTKAFRAIPNNEELEQWSIQRNPYSRLTLPTEVADGVYLLCRKEANWINGVTLTVDGGEHLR